MTNQRTLVAVLTAATFLTAGFAASAASQSDTNMTRSASPPMSKVDRDFSKLSADGTRAYQEIALTRLAIFEGQTAQAKKLVRDADTAFGKAKSDDSVFLKADRDLLTKQDLSDHLSKAKSPATADAKDSKAADAKAGKSAETVAWIPVDGTISLAEDYAMTPAKKKAVGEANDQLRKGDRKGAMERLKLADVDMTVVEAVLPLHQTLDQLHQAAQFIDGGKYYEGSQVLRHIEDSARYDIANYLAEPNGKMKSAHSEMAPATKAQSASTDAAGPEPYTAPDPQYKPMTAEPKVQPQKSVAPNLTEGGKPHAAATPSAPTSAHNPS